ncbi:hypothetical protein QTN25_006257 [Entamoeba marina]
MQTSNEKSECIQNDEFTDFIFMLSNELNDFNVNKLIDDISHSSMITEFKVLIRNRITKAFQTLVFYLNQFKQFHSYHDLQPHLGIPPVLFGKENNRTYHIKETEYSSYGINSIPIFCCGLARLLISVMTCCYMRDPSTISGFLTDLLKTDCCGSICIRDTIIHATELMKKIKISKFSYTFQITLLEWVISTKEKDPRILEQINQLPFDTILDSFQTISDAINCGNGEVVSHLFIQFCIEHDLNNEHNMNRIKSNLIEVLCFASYDDIHKFAYKKFYTQELTPFLEDLIHGIKEKIESPLYIQESFDRRSTLLFALYEIRNACYDFMFSYKMSCDDDNDNDDYSDDDDDKFRIRYADDIFFIKKLIELTTSTFKEKEINSKWESLIKHFFVNTRKRDDYYRFMETGDTFKLLYSKLELIFNKVIKIEDATNHQSIATCLFIGVNTSKYDNGNLVIDFINKLLTSPLCPHFIHHILEYQPLFLSCRSTVANNRKNSEEIRKLLHNVAKKLFDSPQLPCCLGHVCCLLAMLDAGVKPKFNYVNNTYASQQPNVTTEPIFGNICSFVKCCKCEEQMVGNKETGDFKTTGGVFGTVPNKIIGLFNDINKQNEVDFKQELDWKIKQEKIDREARLCESAVRIISHVEPSIKLQIEKILKLIGSINVFTKCATIISLFKVTIHTLQLFGRDDDDDGDGDNATNTFSPVEKLIKIIQEKDEKSRLGFYTLIPDLLPSFGKSYICSLVQISLDDLVFDLQQGVRQKTFIFHFFKGDVAEYETFIKPRKEIRVWKEIVDHFTLHPSELENYGRNQDMSFESAKEAFEFYVNSSNTLTQEFPKQFVRLNDSERDEVLRLLKNVDGSSIFEYFLLRTENDSEFEKIKDVLVKIYKCLERDTESVGTDIKEVAEKKGLLFIMKIRKLLNNETVSDDTRFCWDNAFSAVTYFFKLRGNNANIKPFLVNILNSFTDHYLYVPGSNQITTILRMWRMMSSFCDSDGIVLEIIIALHRILEAKCEVDVIKKRVKTILDVVINKCKGRDGNNNECITNYFPYFKFSSYEYQQCQTTFPSLRRSVSLFKSAESLHVKLYLIKTILNTLKHYSLDKIYKFNGPDSNELKDVEHCLSSIIKQPLENNQIISGFGEIISYIGAAAPGKLPVTEEERNSLDLFSGKNEKARLPEFIAKVVRDYVFPELKRGSTDSISLCVIFGIDKLLRDEPYSLLLGCLPDSYSNITYNLNPKHQVFQPKQFLKDTYGTFLDWAISLYCHLVGLLPINSYFLKIFQYTSTIYL